MELADSNSKIMHFNSVVQYNPKQRTHNWMSFYPYYFSEYEEQDWLKLLALDFANYTKQQLEE